MSSYVQLVGFEQNYEIMNRPPYTIRNAKTKRVIQPHQRQDAYVYIHLSVNGREYYPKFHRLLAKQFIPNDDPENKIFVDHINHCRNDNRLENLRWVTASQNNANVSHQRGRTYNYIYELPPTAHQITEYNNVKFSKIWYDLKDRKIYYDLDVHYRELTPGKHNSVQARACDGKRHYISLNVLRELYP